MGRLHLRTGAGMEKRARAPYCVHAGQGSAARPGPTIRA